MQTEDLWTIITLSFTDICQGSTKKEVIRSQLDKPCLMPTTRHVSESIKSVKALFSTCCWGITLSIITLMRLIIWYRKQPSRSQNQTTSSVSTCSTLEESRRWEDSTMMPCPDLTKQSGSPQTTPKDSTFNVKKQPLLSSCFKAKFLTDKSLPNTYTSAMLILTTNLFR